MTALGSLHEYGLRQLSLDALELSATEFVLLARAGPRPPAEQRRDWQLPPV